MGLKRMSNVLDNEDNFIEEQCPWKKKKLNIHLLISLLKFVFHFCHTKVHIDFGHLKEAEWDSFMVKAEFSECFAFMYYDVISGKHIYNTELMTGKTQSDYIYCNFLRRNCGWKPKMLWMIKSPNSEILPINSSPNSSFLELWR